MRTPPDARAHLEYALSDSGMPPSLAAPDVKVAPLRHRDSIPHNLRLASGVVEGPLRMTTKIEYPNRKGKITKAMVRIGYKPAIPWAETGQPRLEYEPLPADRTQRNYSPRNGNCLAGFISLTVGRPDNFPERVLRFAKKWGVLRLCHHRKPERHRRAKNEVDPPCGGPPQYGGPFSVPVFSEPIEAWGRYSRQLRALLLIAANLRQGQPGRLDDWQAVEEGEPSGLPPREREFWGLGNFATLRGKARLLAERHRISILLWRWLAYGSVKPLAFWNEGQNHWEVGLSYYGLTGRLATELCAILSHGVYTCAGCEEPFGVEWEEKNRPRKKKSWCGKKECKRKAAREASKRHYNRIR